MPWSMTTAAESGKGSLVNRVSLCCTPSSRMVKSFCNNPSTSLPSSSFTVTGTLTKLTFLTSLNIWSRPLSGAFGALPGASVLISCDPGGGGCGLVCDGGLRVLSGCSGFPLDEEEPGSPGIPCGGRFKPGSGALFWGVGASGSGCCAGAYTAARVSAATRTALLVQKLVGRFDMGVGGSPELCTV